MLEPQDRIRFEQAVLPHLNSAANLARWLLGNRADSEDVVQEAMLRAYRFFNGFHGGDARAWLLQIVRNTCYSWLEKNRPAELMTEFNEEVHQQPSANPETLASQTDDRERLKRALESLLPGRVRYSYSGNWKVALIKRLQRSPQSPLAQLCQLWRGHGSAYSEP